MENNFRIDSASISDRGLSNKRPNNEDSFLELNQKGIFAVADGVGGAQAGDVASQMAMEILGEAFSNLQPNEDAEELMKVAIERANSAIHQMAEDLPQLSTMATTIVALHLSGNIGTIGHVGDSRLYRLDESGNLFRETHDHSVVEEEVRAGRMTVSQAANHPSRNIISRALGADSEVQVDMKTIMFEPNTTFLVCSDGITRHIDDFEIRELLITKDKAAQICQKMKDICYQRGAEDNLTAVIARVSNVVEGNGLHVNRVDFEEPTVTAFRPQQEAAVEASNILELGDEIETSPLVMPKSDHLPPIELDVEQVSPKAPQAGIISKPNFVDEEEVSYTESSELVSEVQIAKSEEIAVAKKQVPLTQQEEKVDNYQPGEDMEIEESDFFSKILLGIFTFLIGAIIGAGAIYMYMQNNPPANVPAIPPELSEDVSMTAFENLRRSVDADPAKYISIETKEPEDAVGYYLLGRAHMLLGNYPLAKKTFIESQKLLASEDIGNADVLINDIAAYLAIIENQNAQKVFKSEMKKGADSAEADVAEPNANTSNLNVSNN